MRNEWHGTTYVLCAHIGRCKENRGINFGIIILRQLSVQNIGIKFGEMLRLEIRFLITIFVVSKYIFTFKKSFILKKMNVYENYLLIELIECNKDNYFENIN